LPPDIASCGFSGLEDGKGERRCKVGTKDPDMAALMSPASFTVATTQEVNEQVCVITPDRPLHAAGPGNGTKTGRVSPGHAPGERPLVRWLAETGTKSKRQEERFCEPSTGLPREPQAFTGRVQFTPWENGSRNKNSSEQQQAGRQLRHARCLSHGANGWKGRSARLPQRSKRTSHARSGPFQSFGD
jgi:hypothetical protein